MDNLKDKIVIFTFSIFSIFLSGCDNHDIKEAEKLSGLNLNNKVKFEKKKEQWNNFNGNGFKILVYNITDINYFNNHKNNKNITEFDFCDRNNPFANSEITEFINNGKGYYYSFFSEQESKILVVDMKNGKMIYYYTSM